MRFAFMHNINSPTLELLGNFMVSEVSTKKYRGVSYRFYTLSRGGGVDGERHRELGTLVAFLRKNM